MSTSFLCPHCPRNNVLLPLPRRNRVGLRLSFLLGGPEKGAGQKLCLGLGRSNSGGFFLITNWIPKPVWQGRMSTNSPAGINLCSLFPLSIFFIPPLVHLSKSALHQSYLCQCLSSATDCEFLECWTRAFSPLCCLNRDFSFY